MIGESKAARSGNHRMKFDIAQLVICLFQETRESFPDICIMPFIIGK